MAPTPSDLAEAFSRHRFAEVFPHLAPTVRWEIVGGTVLDGRDAVIAACEESAAFLAGVTTEFTAFRLVVGATTVVVDSRATYRGADGDASTVASCDLYDVDDSGALAAITSYTVELRTVEPQGDA